LRIRFLARNPGASTYASFGDFSLWKITPIRAQFVGGFGRAVWIDAPFGLEMDLIQSFQSEEAHLLSEIAKHTRTDVLSIDPDGYDLSVGESWIRVNFHHVPQTVEEALALVK